MRKRPESGFTLTELLIAGTIMAVLLAALGGLFVSSTRAYNANAAASVTQQTIEIASQLLRQELTLAGYRGIDSGSQNRLIPLPVSVSYGSAKQSDTVTVRYYEDRHLATAELRTVSYSARDDNLRRNTHTGAGAQPAVEGVQLLKVLEHTPQHLRLRLTFSNGLSRELIIPLRNPASTSPSAQLKELPLL